MNSPGGGRGPSKERDRDSTGRSGSRRREVGGGEGTGWAGGRGGEGGAGVFNNENHRKIRWQPNLIGRMS